MKDLGSPVPMPPMSAEQAPSWHGLLNLHRRVMTDRTLVGGQLVHLHLPERDHHPERLTNDVDADVVVRAATHM